MIKKKMDEMNWSRKRAVSLPKWTDGSCIFYKYMENPGAAQEGIPNLNRRRWKRKWSRA